MNEFRFSYLPQVVDLEPFGLGTNFNQEAGVKGFEETGRPGVVGSFPDFSWSGYSNMQGSAFDQRPKTQDLKVFEWTDNVTHIRGRHILKGGTKIRRWLPHFTDSKQYQGVWTYNGFATQNPASPTGTGDAFADFMLGYPRQVQRAFPADTFGGQSTYWHFYVQDDFRATSRLTLNLGLRYEYSPWASGYRGQLGTFDPTSARPIIVASDTDQIDLDSQFSGPSAYALFRNYIQTSSQAGLPLSITSTDKAQFGPRFGFAWRPFGDHDGAARRLRHLLRAGEHRRPREQQHGALPPRRDRDQRPHPEADDGRLLPGQGPHRPRPRPRSARRRRT